MTKPKRPGLLTHLFKKRSHFRQKLSESDMDIAEQMLLDYYVSFVNNHPDLILMLSLDGKIVSYNKGSINEFLGYRPRQKVNYKSLIPKDFFKLLTSAFDEAKKGKSKRVYFDILNKDNQTLHMIGTFIPIETPSKRVEAISFIVKDITEKKKLENKNKLKRHHLEQVQEVANIGSWEYNLTNGKIACSKSCYKIAGLKSSEKLSKDLIFSLIHPKDRDQLTQLINKAITKGTSFTTEFRINYVPTGEVRYIKTKVEVETEAKETIKLIGVIKDFTEQKQLEVELHETNQGYRYIFDHLPAGFWMWDMKEKKLIFASKGLSKILQKSVETLYETPYFWEDMILKVHRDEFNKKNELLAKGDPVEQHYRIEAGDGTVKWIHEQTIPRIDESGKITHLFGRIIDISHEVEMKRKLEYLAKYDAVTSLPNHYHLYDKLDELINDDTVDNFALLYMDLDNFHWIVNYLGHEIGDQVLKRIANRLISLCPENGFLAKENNDAFVSVIYNYQDKDNVFKFAEEIIQYIAKPVKIKDYDFHVTASLGVCFYPDNGKSKLILLENAHTALYHAKSLGKNNYQVYSFDRDINAHKKYTLEKDLRQAIEQEEFEVYYQPQVNAKTNTIVGAEALIRWNHKEWGLVSPGEFIPIAEKKHLIDTVGDWVIHKVCKQLYLWRKQGHTIFPVSINISPVHFLKPGIVETVKEAITKYEIPVKYITLEVTEGSLLQNEEYILETLRELKALGVKIALDDFGTGYSNFQYLQAFDVDIIKIDQSFIQSLFYDEKSETREAAIVSSILHLAKALNLEVIAEGVEEYEQLEFLSQKQCDIIQGYIYARPVPAIEFEQMMQRRYLKPHKQKRRIKPKQERRKYFRFQLPFHMPVKMYVTEINKRKVNIGYATILIENISLGGIRFLSTLRLPVVSDLRLRFEFELMGESFDLAGTLVYKNEDKTDIYSYGVSLDVTEAERDRLASIINQMTVLRKLNQPIPKTIFVEEDPYIYLRKNLM